MEFSKEVDKLRQRTIKRLNNIFITAELIIPYLETATSNLSPTDEEVYSFEVPSTKKKKIDSVKRNREQFLKLIEDTANYDLYKYLVISMVSITEDYVSTIIRRLFNKYPFKLTTNVQGVNANRSIDIRDLISSQSKEELIESIINERLYSLFHASPAKQFEYIQSVFDVEIQQETRDLFIELKATRDLLVHADGLVNEVYCAKVGSMSRAPIGVLIPLNREYFSNSLIACKKLVGRMSVEVKKAFGDKLD